MLLIRHVARFKKDLKKYQHQTTVLRELHHVLKLLIVKKKLPERYRDHLLSGGYSQMRECHIRPDVLLIYWINEEGKELVLERLGSHSELF